jgi:hypothetical protein
MYHLLIWFALWVALETNVGNDDPAVVKFVEHPEHPKERKTKDKFKIVSLAVKPGIEYTPELVRIQPLHVYLLGCVNKGTHGKISVHI